jgi:hypothetical protein
MAENISNCLQRNPGLEQARRSGMPEDVRPALPLQSDADAGKVTPQ